MIRASGNGMAKVEGIRIRNYRVLRDITLGRLWYLNESRALTPMTAVVGKNGVGKSSLFDAFGFLADCLRLGVEEACDERGRGGFERIRSQGTDLPIMFEVCYRANPQAQLMTYQLSVATDDAGGPYVSYERLHQQRADWTSGLPRTFLMLTGGSGVVWKGEFQGEGLAREDKTGFDLESANKFLDSMLERLRSENARVNDDYGQTNEIEYVALQDQRRLGIATLGALRQHPRIAAFREFLEGWYLSYFAPDAARGLPLAGPQRRLSVHGDNLANVVQYMQRENPEDFDSILKKIAGRVPGIDKIDPHRTEDGRLLLRFNDRGFVDPFYAQQMSDGTLKLFAYMLLMEDPNPPPFICIEEPENGLYHKLLEVLAAEFRAHATGESNAPQIFVTTHHPYLVDALTPEEVWVLQKGEDGFATISRASDDKIVKAMVDEGLTLGNLWYSDFLDPRQNDAL